MKIYDRKGFILGLICFLMVIWEATHFDGAKSIVWIGFFSYMGFGSIRASLSAEATAKQEILEERDEKVRRELLGPLWRFPEWITLGLCFIGVGLYAVLWRSDWGGILLFVCFVAATVFALWYNVKYRDLMEREQQNNEDENP